MSDKVSRKRLFDSLRSAQPLITDIGYHPRGEPGYDSYKQRMVNEMGIKNTLQYTTQSLVKRQRIINQILGWRTLPTILFHCKRALWCGYVDKDFGSLGQLSLSIYLYKGIYLAITRRVGDPTMVLVHCDGRWSNITPLFNIK